MHDRIKVLLSIFNYSVKKISNLDSSFENSDTGWKNKTPTISTKTFRMVINLSKNFFKINRFPFFEIKNKYFSTSEKQDQGKGNPLNSKGLAKLLPRIQKLYQITNIFCTTLSSISIQHFYTNWFSPWGTLRLQCICRTKLLIHTTHLYSCLPCKYVTSLSPYYRA